MTNKNTFDKGFIGLLFLLITLTIIIFLIVRTDLFEAKLNSKFSGTLQNNEELEGDNMLEKGFDAIDKAKDAKALIERNNGQSVAE
ncbi:hypothetical protein HZA26_02195 [Candidatus Nomurabacteria bacterium]|nr:hypothetical protein [Candidatus Nomurabacteria bacterium]